MLTDLLLMRGHHLTVDAPVVLCHHFGRGGGSVDHSEQRLEIEVLGQLVQRVETMVQRYLTLTDWTEHDFHLTVNCQNFVGPIGGERAG